MTTTAVDLDRNPWPRAADFMEKVGFTKGQERNSRGEVCAEGAVRFCTPQQGDGVIWREVLSHRGRGASFNDRDDVTKADVLEYFRSAPEITDDELEQVFGPQWEHVVALIRKAATLSESDKRRYYDAVNAAWDHGYRAAWLAVIDYSGPCVAALRALLSVVLFGDYAYVAFALARRHEITAEHYEALTRPWRSLFGPVHPDDPQLEG